MTARRLLSANRERERSMVRKNLFAARGNSSAAAPNRSVQAAEISTICKVLRSLASRVTGIGSGIVRQTAASHSHPEKQQQSDSERAKFPILRLPGNHL